MTFEDKLRSVAEKYDDGGDEAERLIASTLERIAWRIRRGFKLCSSCKERKKPGDFHTDSRESDGLYRVCKVCRTRLS